ncbi:MAG TPA: cytochrome c-type biogenesis protein CcmH [Acidimicrobiales bacterium]|nr:cytochrome c-type biogenesis protein CcmH [Acidimicrobiales bacterium]
MSRRLVYLALAVIAAIALTVGVAGQRGARTEDEKVRQIASTVRCPTCRGLSAAESDAKAAQAVREEIRTQLREGRSATEIRAFLAGRYGRDILLTPGASGVTGLVWVIPVVVLVVAVAGLVAAFRRWRDHPFAVATIDDRVLVEHALHADEGAGR